MTTWIKLLSFGFIIFIYACETKVDLVAEGEESPIVYGFINPTVDTQFVKITKSFVTEGNAFEGALDPSLSEYENLEVWIVAFDGNDSIESYLLQEKTVTDKDSGVFYYPVQTVYYTDEIDFNGSNDPHYDYTYEIRFFGSGKNVSASAPVVGAFIPNNSMAFPNIILVATFNVNGSAYTTKIITVNQSENTKRYEFTLRYHYVELYTDGTEKEKYMDFNYNAWIPEFNSGSDPKDFYIEGESFYSGVKNRLEAQNNEDNVSLRHIGRLDYIFDYAGEDLNTFIVLNEPSTSFNSEQNPYTNITNGIGVWSSRGKTIFPDKVLSDQSLREMAQGQYTGAFKFCSNDPNHIGAPYYCN